MRQLLISFLELAILDEATTFGWEAIIALQSSNPLQRQMRQGRQFHANRIPAPHHAAFAHHGHDPRLADHLATRSPIQHSGQQARLESLDLPAWIAQAGYFEFHLLADQQHSAARQGQQVYALGGDIFTEFANAYCEAFCGQFGEQFGVDQVDLPQVGLGGIGGDAGAVFDCYAAVGIAFDAVPGDQAQLRRAAFAEAMIPVAGEGDDVWVRAFGVHNNTNRPNP